MALVRHTCTCSILVKPFPVYVALCLDTRMCGYSVSIIAWYFQGFNLHIDYAPLSGFDLLYLSSPKLISKLDTKQEQHIVIFRIHSTG